MYSWTGDVQPDASQGEAPSECPVCEHVKAQLAATEAEVARAKAERETLRAQVGALFRAIDGVPGLFQGILGELRDHRGELDTLRQDKEAREAGALLIAGDVPYCRRRTDRAQLSLVQDAGAS